MLLKSLPVSLMLILNSHTVGSWQEQSPHTSYCHWPSRSVPVVVSEWTLTLMTSHKKEPTKYFLVYRDLWEMDLDQDQRDWMGLKEKLDVTLERPDVTLYGLIELLVCLFCFLLGCVCVCVRECLLLYLLLFWRTVFSLCQSVTLLSPQRCIILVCFCLLFWNTSSLF